MEQLLEVEMQNILRLAGKLYQTTIKITDRHGIVMAKTNDEAIKIMTRAIVEVLGEDHLNQFLLIRR